MTNKKFFRVKLSDKCPVPTKIVNGITLTKKWQVKVGEVGDLGKFPNVEAQVVEKKGNDFVSVGETVKGATKGTGEGSGQSSDSAPTSAQDAEGAQVNEPIPDFNNMTVDQLKNLLIAKGVAQNELRNATKAELIERADFIWSQE